MKTPGNDSWESYWAHGFLTSCAGAFTGNYEGKIRALWEKRFTTLADGTRILDIGTGNGAIALLAAAAAQRLERSFVIDALDLADIQPQRDLRDESRAWLSDINFHARTDACRSGFDNDSFDLVTGNFALEYTDWPATVSELTRVTARDGEHLFVIHNDESVIADTAREELAHIDLLLNKSRLLDRARELIETIGTAAKPTGGIGNFMARQAQHQSADPVIEKARLALNQAAGQVSGVIERSEHPEILMTALGRISQAYRLLQTSDPETALAHIDQARTEIAANAARLTGLCRAASTKADIGRLVDLYETHGFAYVCVDTLSEDTVGLIAWILRARPV